jgi:hypothetical protein
MRERNGSSLIGFHSADGKNKLKEVGNGRFYKILKSLKRWEGKI